MSLARERVSSSAFIGFPFIARRGFIETWPDFYTEIPMKKNLFLAFVFALAATFAIAQESSTPKDPAQQSDPAAQTKPDDKSTTPAQDTTGAQSANKESSSAEAAEGHSKAKASNNAVSQQLHDKFASDPALSNVKFHVKKGIVTLTGKVDSAEEVARAKELAQSVDGVKSVRNHLKVASTSAAAASDKHANGTAEAKNTTPDADKNAAGEQGINPTASGSPAKDASGTNTATSTGGNTSTTPTTTASGNPAPSAAGSIAGNTSAASGTQTSSGTTGPSASGSASSSSSLPASDQNAASMPQSSASGDSASLQTTIQDKFKSEPLLSSSNVNVNVTDSAIELSGTVATGKEKQTAERIAQSYAGNRKVVDRITVTGRGSEKSGDNSSANPSKDSGNPNQSPTSGEGATPAQPNGSNPTSANPSTPNGNPPTNQTPPTPEQSAQPK
jgi:osmotically-inducible protein OsmY